MSQSNEDNYREAISETDQGKEFIDFSTITKPEEVLPLEEEATPLKEEAAAPLEENFFSIKESIMKEPEELPQKVGAFPYIEIKEQEEEEPISEQPIAEQEPIMEAEVPSNTPIIEEEPVIEEPVQVKDTPVVEERPVVVKPAPVKPIIIESYQEIRDEFWNQVNPSNKNRFQDCGLEENEENRAFLNDLSVKITFLDDDLEDRVISEIEAVFKMKEIKKLLD